MGSENVDLIAVGVCEWVIRSEWDRAMLNMCQVCDEMRMTHVPTEWMLKKGSEVNKLQQSRPSHRTVDKEQQQKMSLLHECDLNRYFQRKSWLFPRNKKDSSEDSSLKRAKKRHTHIIIENKGWTNIQIESRERERSREKKPAWSDQQYWQRGSEKKRD